jgi:hypothetical protein
VGTFVVVVVAPVEAFDVGVVVFEVPELGDDGDDGDDDDDGDDGDDGDAGDVVVGAAGLNAISVLNSRPIDSVIVSVSAAGMVVHVDVFRLMVKVVTCQSPRGELEF